MHRLQTFRSLTWLAVALLSAVVSGAASRGANWPEFRGDNGLAVSEEPGLATKWNIDRPTWKIDLPGTGHSSPVIWNDKLFLTSAGQSGTDRMVLCLDATTGKTLWTRTIKLKANPRHPKSSWASSTPAVDGERVYAVFADVENYLLTAYDFDGKQIWQKNIGGFESQHGQGSSPIVFEDLVILTNDQDGPSSIVAFDRRTGETAWTAPRKSASQSTSYATPFVYRPKEGPAQLICSSSQSGVSGLDLRTGKTIWTTDSLPARTVGSPVLAAGLVLQTCGGGGQGKSLVAVDPNGKGDVSKTHVKYERTKILPYVPTPLVCGDLVFLWGDHGIVCCMDPLTGRDAWKNRVGGDFSSSPICAGGMVFNVDEHGNVIVLAASRQFKELGRFSLGDQCHSTPAAANGRIYFRTFHHLACVQMRP